MKSCHPPSVAANVPGTEVRPEPHLHRGHVRASTLQPRTSRSRIYPSRNVKIHRENVPTAKLELYGSSCNGFAIAHSDLDISLTLTDHPTDESINSIEIIDTLAEKLKRMPGIGNIQPITSAKVPILKFVHYETQIEGDISLYNILAQENTKMLGMYAAIDPRVKVDNLINQVLVHLG